MADTEPQDPYAGQPYQPTQPDGDPEVPGYRDPGQAYPGQAYPGQAYPAPPGYRDPGQAYPGPAYPGPPGYRDPGPAYPGQRGDERPPVYPPPGYPQPGDSGQRQQGYPPPGYPPPGYPQPSYPGYGPYQGYPPQQPYGGYPFAVPGPSRPGTATAAAVLAFVAAGLLIVAAIILFSGASATSSFGDSFNTDTGSQTAELSFDGVVNLVAAALLIIGGVQLLGRKSRGRTLLATSTVLVIVAGIYWIARTNTYGATVFFALTFGALVVIAASLASTSTTRRWLQTDPAAPLGHYSH